MKRKKIDYDWEGDSLYVSLRPSHYSIDISDYVVDFDSNDFVCGIEILNASKNIAVPKKYLQNILKADFAIRYEPHIVKILLTLKTQVEPVVFNLPLVMELGKKPHEEKATITA